MKYKKILLSAICAVSLLSGGAQESVKQDSLFTPYKLNYLPAGSPAWMAQMVNPDGLDYNALVDSFNVYLHDNPGARRKSPETKQVVNHFRRFQKAYSRFVQPDGKIRLPLASNYHGEAPLSAFPRLQTAAFQCLSQPVSSDHELC